MLVEAAYQKSDIRNDSQSVPKLLKNRPDFYKPSLG